MLVYILVMILPFLLFPMIKMNDSRGTLSIANRSICLKKRTNDGRKLYLACTLFVLFMISTMRADTMGADFSRYVQIFYDNTGWYRNSEFLYGWLNKLAYTLFGKNYIGLSLCVNLIIFIPLYYHLKCNTTSKYIVICLAVFVLNPYLYIQSTFNIIRQGCATGVLMFATRYLKKRKWMKYLICILIAFSFHEASAVFLLLIPVRLIKWNKKKLFLLATSCFCASIALKGSSVMLLLMKFFNFESYYNYKTSKFDFAVFYLFVYLVVCFFVYQYKQLYRSQQEKFFVDMYLISLCALMLLVQNDVAYRIYIMLLLLFLPAIEIISKNMAASKVCISEFVPTCYVLYYGFMLVLFFYSILKQDGQNAYYPFRFFFYST